jgi:transcriptional regulator with XRE-family HTH domain
MQTVGERLHHVRTIAQLTQTELAELAGLKSTRHVGLIEEGERDNLTTATSSGLCEALGMSMDWFLLGKGDAPTEAEIVSAVESGRARLAKREAS